ncbi:hypothetical protein EV702DRAFT_1049007 [Suillus placidus]|uniref:Uncharacterized protein n=1 Tax=Suillus placidus TaxID=48579 RepID=A0A9P6ZLM7_9AGAM|nr:hypothetical protein EV702DRAFT_1049007 [Suillus placidus]
MSHIPPEWCSYASHMAFLRNGMNHMPMIPEDWALHATNLASEWVEQQFLAHIASRPLVPPPPGLDAHTILSCDQLALFMANAYQHPKSGMNDAQEEALLAKFPPTEIITLDHPSMVIDSGYRIILWYILDGLSPWVQNNMYMATIAMGDLLKKSITNRKSSNWRVHGSDFQPAEVPELTPGCINIAPCWFQQGHECYGPPPKNPGDGFRPKVSATMKGDRSLSIIMTMQQPALIASAALRIMHPQLYLASIRTHIKLSHWSAEQELHDMHNLLKHWASIYTRVAIMCNRQSPYHRDQKCPPEAFDILTCIRSYCHAVMQLTNLGIDLVYNPGIMVSYSGLLVRHGIHVDGDLIVWVWFLRDSMPNYAGTPRPDYARYNLVDLDAYKLAKYNQADFVVYGTL